MELSAILEELPNLGPDERHLIFARLCDLQELDLLRESPPTADEKKLLDHALAQFEIDRDPGKPWRQIVR